MVEQEYQVEGLRELEPREEGDSDYVEAYSGVGDLKIREKEEEIEFLWETDSGFRDVLEAVEGLYRRRNGIQVLDKDYDTGELTHDKIRNYVLGGSLEEARSPEVGDWSDHYLIQVCGPDFHVSWDQRMGDEYRVRVTTQGSGLAPFASVYMNTVDREASEQVVEDVWDEFFDEPRGFPGFWDPSEKYN